MASLLRVCLLSVVRLLLPLFGRSATRRAFRSIFARFISPRSQIPVLQSQIPVPESHFPFRFAKDAAPIPNAVGLLKINFPFSNFNFQFP